MLVIFFLKTKGVRETILFLAYNLKDYKKSIIQQK